MFRVSNIGLISFFPQAWVYFYPTVDQQKTCERCGEQGLNGDLVIVYDVNQDNGLGDIRVRCYPQNDFLLLFKSEAIRYMSQLLFLFFFHQTHCFAFPNFTYYQISDGYFVHHFAPSNLPRIPKNVVFVIDKSGSMHGRKIIQVKYLYISFLCDISLT